MIGRALLAPSQYFWADLRLVTLCTHWAKMVLCSFALSLVTAFQQVAAVVSTIDA